MSFAVEIVTLCDSLKCKASLIDQLLRSGTSIGANIHEANYAHGKNDFIAKLQIALKECYETEYWLELLARTNKVTNKPSSSAIKKLPCRGHFRCRGFLNTSAYYFLSAFASFGL